MLANIRFCATSHGLMNACYLQSGDSIYAPRRPARYTRITGAPPEYVNCSFTEVPPGSIFAGGRPAAGGRMVGIIRQGRSEEVKRKLVTALADAWVSVTAEPVEDIALFVHEVPGYQVMEYGQLLPEASEDQR